MFEINAMTPDDCRRRLRSSSTIGLLRGLGLTLAAVAATCVAAPTTARAATDYTFSNASAVLNGTPVSISGLVTLGAGEWYARIQLTGASPYAGTYCYCWNAGDIVSRLQLSQFEAVAGPLQIHFANDGSLASVTINNVTDNAPTGSIVGIAGPTDYYFQHASTVLNGTPEAITGHFEFDPLTQIEYDALIQFSGGPPYAGPYYSDAVDLGESKVIDFSPLLHIGFRYDLSVNNDYDPLTSVEIVTASGADDFSPTGYVGAAPAPEPSSLAVLSAALGLFLLGTRTIGRAGKPHPPWITRA